MSQREMDPKFIVHPSHLANCDNYVNDNRGRVAEWLRKWALDGKFNLFVATVISLISIVCKINIVAPVLQIKRIRLVMSEN